MTKVMIRPEHFHINAFVSVSHLHIQNPGSALKVRPKKTTMSTTEQLRSVEEALAESERRFQELFEIAPEGITIIDPGSLVFVRCNRNAPGLLKMQESELLRIGPMDISPKYQPDGSLSKEKYAYYIQEALNGEKPVFEWLGKDGEGKLVFFEVRMVALAHSSRPLLYASFIDITERKTIQSKLISQNRVLSQIADMQSHQVRKPVASILGLISLFNFKEPQDPVNAEILLKIKDASVMFDHVIK